MTISCNSVKLGETVYTHLSVVLSKCILGNRMHRHYFFKTLAKIRICQLLSNERIKWLLPFTLKTQTLLSSNDTAMIYISFKRFKESNMALGMLMSVCWSVHHSRLKCLPMAEIRGERHPASQVLIREHLTNTCPILWFMAKYLQTRDVRSTSLHRCTNIKAQDAIQHSPVFPNIHHYTKCFSQQW